MTGKLAYQNAVNYFCRGLSDRTFMKENTTSEISKFTLAGINYKKTDASVRGRFAINQDQYTAILALAPTYGIRELFILSTCNRTEIYGICENPAELIQLLCSQTNGDISTFRELAYIKSGTDAVRHIFEVGAGLDSQILGDYEIIGQIKQAVKFSRDNGCIGNLLERVVNTVLQASKSIKNQTELSSGTVSVSFAAVQYIRETAGDITGKKILLIGTGKIGRNTCRNIIDYLGTKNIVLANRTESTAAALAQELGVQYTTVEDLPAHIAESSIILVATNAAAPTLQSIYLQNSGEKLIIDLSIPANVEASAKEIKGITVIDVDELSKQKDKTLQKREAEIPKARHIIEEHIIELMQWYHLRRQVPVLNAVKLKLKTLHTCRLFSAYSTLHPLNHDEKVQQVINVMAVKMKHQTLHGCEYIGAIHDFISTGKH
jgi:glutamyl-tRNA reductase